MPHAAAAEEEAPRRGSSMTGDTMTQYDDDGGGAVPPTDRPRRKDAQRTEENVDFMTVEESYFPKVNASERQKESERSATKTGDARGGSKDRVTKAGRLPVIDARHTHIANCGRHKRRPGRAGGGGRSPLSALGVHDGTNPPVYTTEMVLFFSSSVGGRKSDFL